MLLSQLLCLLDYFLDGANHVEGLLGQGIILACEEKQKGTVRDRHTEREREREREREKSCSFPQTYENEYMDVITEPHSPPRMLLKPLMVSLRGTSLPK